MTDKTEILIPFGGEYLALSPEQFEEARNRGRALVPPKTAAAPAAATLEVLDAEGMENRTGIPASWWLEQARRDAIPHIRAGKYVRFDFEKTLERIRFDDRTRSGGPSRAGKPPLSQPVARGRRARATTCGAASPRPGSL